MDFLALIAVRILTVLAVLFAVCVVGAASVAVLQESKIWKPRTLPSLSLFGGVKVFLLNLIWITFCFIGSILIVISSILTLGMIDRTAMAAGIEKFTANFIVRCFVGRVQVIGTENLPDNNLKPAPIYIANHASQIDVAAVYQIQRQFLWVAKQSVLYVPGVGTLMWLAGHILVNRSRGGKSNFYPKANEAVQSGLPLFIFPQGTRRIAERLPPKRGAFVVAQENKSPLVPISVHIPEDAWNSWHPVNVVWGGTPPSIVITIHRSIPVSGSEDRGTLEDRCMEQIYSVLPKIVDDAKTK